MIVECIHTAARQQQSGDVMLVAASALIGSAPLPLLKENANDVRHHWPLCLCVRVCICMYMPLYA